MFQFRAFVSGFCCAPFGQTGEYLDGIRYQICSMPDFKVIGWGTQWENGEYTFDEQENICGLNKILLVDEAFKEFEATLHFLEDRFRDIIVAIHKKSVQKRLLNTQELK